jgi:hypothetical protein
MIKAYPKLILEIENIERLYVGTMYAYDSALQSVVNEIESGLREPSEPFQGKLADFYDHDRVASNADSFRRNNKSIFPKHVQEILFVRVISVLEVFLVDCVQEIFLARRDLFRRDDRLEIPYSQLLSFESIADVSTYLINKESSALRNRSFQDIAKYYARWFGIDFKAITKDYTSLIEYHDRRHLLIHRLGYTDPKYRRDYNTPEKRVTVSRHYLLTSFLSVRGFASAVVQYVSELIEGSEVEKKITEPSCICTLTVQLLTPKGKLPFEPSFTFACDDKVIVAKDIVYSQIQGENDDISILELRGKIRQVDTSIDQIKRYKKSGDLKIVELKFRRRLGSKSNVLSKEFISLVREMFPDTKVTNETRREAARIFGISVKQAKRILHLVHSHITKDVADEVFEFLRQSEPLAPNIHEAIVDKFNLTYLQAKAAVRQYLQSKKMSLHLHLMQANKPCTRLAICAAVSGSLCGLKLVPLK